MPEFYEIYVIRCEDPEGQHQGYFSGFSDGGKVLLTNYVGKAEIVGFTDAVRLVSRLQRADPASNHRMLRLA